MRYFIKLFGIIFMISILSLVPIQTASASPVIYSFYGTATGDLNGLDFTSKNFVINLYGDPDDLVLIFVEGPSTFWIEDVNDGTFSTYKSIFFNAQYDMIGFAKSQFDGFRYDIMDFQNAAFDDFNYTAPYGPITTSVSYGLWFNDIPTTIGDLTFTSVSNVTFEVSAVPIPSAVWLFVSGLIGIVGVRRKYKK